MGPSRIVGQVTSWVGPGIAEPAHVSGRTRRVDRAGTPRWSRVRVAGRRRWC